MKRPSLGEPGKDARASRPQYRALRPVKALWFRFLWAAGGRDSTQCAGDLGLTSALMTALLSLQAAAGGTEGDDPGPAVGDSFTAPPGRTAARLMPGGELHGAPVRVYGATCEVPWCSVHPTENTLNRWRTPILQAHPSSVHAGPARPPHRLAELAELSERWQGTSSGFSHKKPLPDSRTIPAGVRLRVAEGSCKWCSEARSGEVMSSPQPRLANGIGIHSHQNGRRGRHVNGKPFK